MMQLERTVTTLRRPWEERKLEARALEEKAAIRCAEGRSILPESSNTLEEAVLQYERLLIRAALTYTNGNVSAAARALGMSAPQSLAYAIEHRHQELTTLCLRRRNQKNEGE